MIRLYRCLCCTKKGLIRSKLEREFETGEKLEHYYYYIHYLLRALGSPGETALDNEFTSEALNNENE